MKKIIFPLYLLLLCAGACKKDSQPGGNDASGAIINPATGWQKVTAIPFTFKADGLPGDHRMSPYDLTMAGSEMALLYSEDYKLQGMDGHHFFKLKLAGSGTTDAARNTVALNYTRYKNYYPVYHFVPGSFTTISAQFSDDSPSECAIFDGVTGLIAAGNFGMGQYRYVTQWLSDGSMLWGTASDHIASSWLYHYPDVSNFTYTVNEWAGDSARWIFSTAMKLTDNKVYDAGFSYRNEKVYFSVIKNTGPVVSGGSPNFDIVYRAQVPGLDLSDKGYELLAAATDGDTETMLVGERTISRGGADVEKVHGFRWNKATNALTVLYTGIPVTRLMSDALHHIGPNQENNTNETRFTPDGSAYFLMSTQGVTTGGPTPNTQGIYIINSSGVKTLGLLTDDNFGKENNDVYRLSTCRYINGSFYAIVHPMSEYYFDKNSTKFRMELVKITP